MKLSYRIVACASLIAAAIATTSLPRVNNAVSGVHSGTLPGPAPDCNPFTQPCPVIR